MEHQPPTVVRWHDGRDVYVYPDGVRLYVDEVQAMLAGAEERRMQQLTVDDLDEVRAKIEELRAAREA
ncbi:hypothetical protein FXF51_06240 [Nonomuraea sp. PA05]|uniref:hypothetical protein n=1 Tax=Nonomuraea sp. PA05 TaxID=2604466 RepID=UPI0011D36B37|nr:hypothetical protein [Nonomuraea sp. PA05]TYB69760.1 hypothetical protein FXF51_06240 [Nonomuraea sp. PA05]